MFGSAKTNPEGSEKSSERSCVPRRAPDLVQTDMLALTTSTTCDGLTPICVLAGPLIWSRPMSATCCSSPIAGNEVSASRLGVEGPSGAGAAPARFGNGELADGWGVPTAAPGVLRKVRGFLMVSPGRGCRDLVPKWAIRGIPVLLEWTGSDADADAAAAGIDPKHTLKAHAAPIRRRRRARRLAGLITDHRRAR